MSTPYRAFDVRLAGRRLLSPSFIRITLAGDDLADCSPTLLDQRVKLLFGPDEALAPVLTAGGDWYDALLAAGQQGPALRTYTLVAVRPATDQPHGPGEVDIDVAVHPLTADEPAPGMRFAQESPLGARTVLVAGDRTIEGHERVGVAWRDQVTDRVLLVGDETALPAVLNIVATLPQTTRGRVVLEVPRAEDVREVALPPAMTIRWCVREHGQRAVGVFEQSAAGASVGSPGAGSPASPDKPDELLWDELADDARRQAWIAGEAGWVRGLRAEARAAAVPRGEVSFMGYWRKGAAGN